jgi:hypothetical protein
MSAFASPGKVVTPRSLSTEKSPRAQISMADAVNTPG